jgi:hypothetical protein
MLILVVSLFLLPTLTITAKASDPSTQSNSAGFALRFGGTDDYVDVGDRNSLESLSAMTVEAWIRLSSSSGDQAVISKYRHNSNDNLDDTFYLGVLNGTGRWQLNSGDSYSVVNGNIKVDDGFWLHVAGTWNGSTMRLYIDGVLDVSLAYAGSGQTNDVDTPITIGRSVNVGTPAWFLDGQIDDVRVWSVARSQTEIQTLMNRSLSGNEVGLLAYWDLDEGSGQITYDATDNHNNGQLGSTLVDDGNDPVWITSNAPLFYGTVPTLMPVWKALLLVYHNIDVDYVDHDGNPQHLTTTMPENEVLKGLWAFRQYASIAHDFSEGQAVIQYDAVHVSRPIISLTSMGDSYWVSPTDSRQELDQYAPSGAYDSIHVYWPQTDFSTGQQIPSFGWGWGLRPSSWSNGATYATVANAPDWMWELPTVGEPWLHEWLHGVCDYYSDQGYTMPTGNADGASSHGYIWSSTTGWGNYYRDLMTGRVLENSAYTGISADAWQSGTILGYEANVVADYFCTSTINAYQRSGTVVWQSNQQNVLLGNSAPADNRLYASANFSHDFTVVGRAYIPSSGVGAYDTVAVALRNDQVEYWATLAYGTNLTERNHISIMRNDSWGTLIPFTLNPGWYTIKVMVDYQNEIIRMKAWADGDNEPDWQTSRTLDSGWVVTDVGFRHYGQGTSVDDLFVIGTGGGGENKVFLPIVLK